MAALKKVFCYSVLLLVISFSRPQSSFAVVGTAAPLQDLNQQGSQNVQHIEAFVGTGEDAQDNERPIVGILAQAISHSLEDVFADMNFTSYIGAAYVKFMESSGARVVPVLINQTDEYYEMIFNSTNGLLIPGGAVSLTDSGYARAGKKLFEMAKTAWDEKQDPFPIWGTCLGFELLALLAADGQPNLAACNSSDQALPLSVTDEWWESYISLAASPEIFDILTAEPVTVNFHRWCLTPENFSAFHMHDFWKLLATGHDWQDLEFVAIMEARNYPIWASQFHPEKNAYEWTRKYSNIPHFPAAIKSAAFFADFFVQQARRSSHHFESRELEEEHLIYSHTPFYTGKKDIDYSMQQCYFF